DANSLVARIEDYGGSELTTAYTYTYARDSEHPEPPNLVRTVTTPNDLVTCYAYNEFGQQIAVYEDCDYDRTTDSIVSGILTSTTYDDAGRVESVTDALGYTTRYIYHDGDERADEIVR